MNSRSLVMEKSNKRGKIPQSDWPLIMARYEAGETLASIARTYDCSPPAISYVVSKSRARQPARDNPATGPSGTESQLVKAIASELAEPVPADSRGTALRSDDATPDRRTGHGTARGGDRRRAPIPPPRLRRQQLGNGRDHRMTRETNGLRRDGFAERGPHPVARARIGRNRKRAARAGRDRACGPLRPSPLLRDEADTRHRLHLSLGNGAPSHNGSGEPVIPVIGPVRRRRQPARSGAPPSRRPIRRRAARMRPNFPRPDRVPTTVPPAEGRDRRRLPQGRYRRVYRS